MDRFPTPTGPGEKVILDLTDMGPEHRAGGMRYWLVTGRQILWPHPPRKEMPVQ